VIKNYKIINKIITIISYNMLIDWFYLIYIYFYTVLLKLGNKTKNKAAI
jgi:hypothetical protein